MTKADRDRIAAAAAELPPPPLASGAATEAKQDETTSELQEVCAMLKAPLVVTGPLTDEDLRKTPLPVAGAVAVSNLPATQAIVGTVNVANFPETQPVSGVVAVSNLPATQPVSGSVAVSNLPATQPVSGAVSVSNLPATQAVSVAALPLPSGAAQDGTDIASPTAMPAGGAGIRGWLSAIWTKLNGSLAVTGTFWQATQPVSGAFYQATQPVSAASLPLPSGAAQDGNDISSPTAMPAGGAGIRGWLSAIWTKLNGSLAVTGTFWQATQPVSGAFYQATQPVSAAALPLPSGAAQDGTDITSPTAMPAGGAGIRGWLSAIWTKLNGSLAVTGTFWQATQPISAASLPLPTGAAQDGIDITSPTAMPAGGAGIRGWLSAIWTKLNGSLAVTGTFWQATQPVSGTFWQATQPVSGTFFQATQPVSLATNTPDVTDRAGRLVGVVSNANVDVALSTRLKPADTLAGVTTVAAVTAITNPLPAGTNVLGALVAATLCVTAVSTANAGVTATLPAVASQFHYISRIIIERVATTAVVGTAVLTYTSTNLPGSWARTTGNAAPVGQQMKDVDETLGPELKSSVANTNTTIVAPAAGATAIVRITVYYRAAA